MKPQHDSELKARARSFGYAFEGWQHLIRTQPNAWVHGFFTVAVLVVGLWLQISLSDWAILVVMMSLVWFGELANTAVEAIVDLVSPDNHPLAKVAKDTAAGAVLAAALGAIIVGLLILGPPLLTKLFG